MNLTTPALTDLLRALRLSVPARGLALNSPPSGVQQVSLDSVLFSPELSDITFVVEGAKRRAHRWVVAARCPYWRALWASGMRESAQTELALGMRLPVFDAVMLFVYTELTSGVNEETCFEVLGLASEWQLDKLKNACESFMIMGLDAENAESMLEHADLYVRRPASLG